MQAYIQVMVSSSVYGSDAKSDMETDPKMSTPKGTTGDMKFLVIWNKCDPWDMDSGKGTDSNCLTLPTTNCFRSWASPMRRLYGECGTCLLEHKEITGVGEKREKRLAWEQVWFTCLLPRNTAAATLNDLVAAGKRTATRWAKETEPQARPETHLARKETDSKEMWVRHVSGYGRTFS